MNFGAKLIISRKYIRPFFATKIEKLYHILTELLKIPELHADSSSEGKHLKTVQKQQQAERMELWTRNMLVVEIIKRKHHKSKKDLSEKES